MPENPLPPIRYGTPEQTAAAIEHAGVSIDRLDVAWDTLMEWIVDPDNPDTPNDTVERLMALSKVAPANEISTLLAAILKADDNRRLQQQIIITDA